MQNLTPAEFDLLRVLAEHVYDGEGDQPMDVSDAAGLMDCGMGRVVGAAASLHDRGAITFSYNRYVELLPKGFQVLANGERPFAH